MSPISTIKPAWRAFRRTFTPFRWEQRYVALLHFRNYQALRKHDGIHSLQPFDQNCCIFIHIPKNGGISVANGLFGKDRMLGGHYTSDFYRIVFGNDFHSYFKFAIVRNPWDRVVSAYHYLKAGGLDFRDREWERKHISRFATFGEFVEGWVRPRNLSKGMHFTPQHEFICSSDGRIAVDYMGRFENLPESFTEICHRLGLKGRMLPHSNRSPRRDDFRRYYTDHQAEIVSKVYHKDITTFGYSFDRID